MSGFTVLMRWTDVRSTTQPSCWLDVSHLERIGLQVAVTGTRRGEHISFAIQGSETTQDSWPTVWEELGDDYVLTGFRTTAPHLWPGCSTVRRVYLDCTPRGFRYLRVRPYENRLTGFGAQLTFAAFEVPRSGDPSMGCEPSVQAEQRKVSPQTPRPKR